MTSVLNLTVIVAALGYFVDLFDIALFGVVRTASLKDLGVTEPALLLSDGIRLYNMQMIGMMIGGILWGIMADKKGRLSVMFGSILMYSLGNIANAFVTSVDQYALCRFVTGIGLAGELGAAITIVAETLPKEKRGLGTTLVATVGLCGSVTAAYIGQKLNWKTAYVTGGVLGLLLLAARVKMSESGMFNQLKENASGDMGKVSLLLKPGNLWKYVASILIGVPIYFITGILFTFSPELTRALGVVGEVKAGEAIMYGSIGLALGDLLSGLLSQLLQSRKRAVLVCLMAALGLTLLYLTSSEPTPGFIYSVCFGTGLFAGYWAVLVTMAAEQFGTNLRGTVATTVPNFVRGSAVLVTLSFTYLKGGMEVPRAAMAVGLVWFAFSLIGLWSLEETFHKDLGYLES